MSRTLIVLFLSLAAGLAAHQGWRTWRAPCSSDELSCQLAWMRSDLRLTEEQFERVVQLHAQSTDRLRQLAVDISRMEGEFAAFEAARRNEGRVDFIEFARFVEERRQVNAAVDTSARSLIAATADIMSPQQRLRYLALVAPAVDPAERHAP